MIEIYTIAYNEEVLLPFFIKWYRNRFPNCRIVVYDNESTDRTKEIAFNNNCEVITYYTDNQLSDSKYLEIKNNCWKNSKTDWVIVCDVDEWLDINEEDLRKEISNRATLIKTHGYNMCNITKEIDYSKVIHGVRSVQYDKFICFNKNKIKEINYSPGAHNIKPIGGVKYSDMVYKLLHMKFIDEDYMVNRYNLFNSRMSKENKEKGWGIQYTNPEEIIRRDFKNHLKASYNIYE